MADPAAGDTVIDFDTMSDEEFMALDPKDLQEVVLPEDEEEGSDEDDEAEGVDQGDGADGGEGQNSTPGNDENDPAPNGEGGVPDADAPGGDPDPNAAPIPDDPAKAAVAPVPGEPAKQPVKAAPKKPEVDPASKGEGDPDPAKAKPTEAESEAAMDFFTKVSAPIKADGKIINVRSPEDAIRLMQQGVNYSRRMEELKPLRAMNQMLESNQLNDPTKLNFLIDLSKGDPGAIKKLLQDHKIDPMDIDTSNTDTPYKAKNYQGDPKDMAFDEAIRTTVSTDEGKSLIGDINRDWDDVSKDALHEQPDILQNLLAQKTSGVYSKIKTELSYQRALGFLTDVPFLKAYHQVGQAMENAGVFKTADDQPKTPAAKPAPLATGRRKAAPKPKPEQPNPNISSATPPRSAAGNPAQNNEPDYSTLSDEDFMKLKPPG